MKKACSNKSDEITTQFIAIKNPKTISNLCIRGVINT